MSGETSQQTPGTDPFSAFWTEWLNRMTSAGMPPSAPPPDFAAQMRRAFFDAMAEHADRFLRSEAFLKAMKQSMDNALAWQQMLTQFLQKGVATAQMPSRADADHVVLLVRGMEERVLGKLEELSRRVDRLEGVRGAARGRPTKSRPARSAKRGKKT